MNKDKLIFWITFVVSLLLIVGGFFVPPMGVIDGSVITAVGELIGFAVLAQLPNLLQKGGKIKHKDTEIEINN